MPEERHSVAQISPLFLRNLFPVLLARIPVWFRLGRLRVENSRDSPRKFVKCHQLRNAQ